MSNISDRIFMLIEKHKIAFAISLTLFLIGFFSGIFYTTGHNKEISDNIITEVKITPSFFGFLINILLPNLIVLFILYLTGLNKISALTIVPFIIIFKGYDAGSMLINSLNGFAGFIEFLFIFIPLAVAYFAVYVLGGMVSLCTSANKLNYDPNSYNNFFIVILMVDGLACLYYAIIKWLLSLIFK